MNPSNLRMALVLGSLSALGPLAIDMYLPAFPAMALSFATDEGMIQHSMMAFFLGLAGGQLIMGPLSDKIGRRKTIFIGLTLYALAAAGCLFALKIEQLIGFRVLQGMGSAVGMSVGMAVVRDLYSGLKAARLMSLIVMVVGIAPVMAPLLGGLVITVAPWRMIFATMIVAPIAVMISVAFFMPETTTTEFRARFKASKLLSHYASLITSRQFIPFVAVAAFAQSGLFIYISGSAFFFIDLHHLSPVAFSFLFALNAFGMIGAAQLNARVIRRYGPIKTVRMAGSIYALSCIILLLMTLFKVTALLPYCIFLFTGITMLPIIMPSCSMMALNAWRPIAGTAAAMMGALQFGAGAIATATVAFLANGTALPMFALMVAVSTLSLVLAFLILPNYFDVGE